MGVGVWGGGAGNTLPQMSDYLCVQLGYVGLGTYALTYVLLPITYMKLHGSVRGARASHPEQCGSVLMC